MRDILAQQSDYIVIMHNLKILSLNVGMSDSLAGLTTLIKSGPVDIVLLQEVRISTSQLNNLLANVNFKGEVNIDTDSLSKPGTAVAWRSTLLVENVFSVVKCRLQVLKIGSCVIMNIYAPSGTEKRK